MEQLIGIIILLLLGFFAGRSAEKNHFASIRKRELKYEKIPVSNIKTLPNREITESHLALGSVVISVDYFKRFLSSFRLFFGGELRSYSPLIERGRREALLRMKESCPNADHYSNVRVETAAISQGQGKSIGCVEITAYSTALKFKSN